jgi:hypothetical protein
MFRNKWPRIAVAVWLAWATVVTAQQAADAPRDALQSLLKEVDDGASPREMVGEFLALADQYPEHPAALEALTWVASQLRNRPEALKALQKIEQQHLKSERLTAACAAITRVPSTRSEALLERIVAENPHPDVQSQACWQWAQVLEQQQNVRDQLRTQPELADRIAQYYGPEYGEYLRKLSQVELEKKRQRVYEKMLASFADVPILDQTMGQYAEQALFQIRHLSVGKVAPEIEGEDIHGVAFKLSDYRGSVIVLSFWGHW